MLHAIKKIIGTLGWLLLGIVLMRHKIGPWWVGWVPLAVSVCVITVQVDGLFSTKEDWEI